MARAQKRSNLANPAGRGLPGFYPAVLRDLPGRQLSDLTPRLIGKTGTLATNSGLLKQTLCQTMNVCVTQWTQSPESLIRAQKQCAAVPRAAFLVQ